MDQFSGIQRDEVILWLLGSAIALAAAIGVDGLWIHPQSALNRGWLLAGPLAVLALRWPIARAYSVAARALASMSWVATAGPATRRRVLRVLLTALALAALAFVLFQLQPARNYGDSFRLVKFVDSGAVFHKRAPLSLATWQLVHQLTGPSLGLTAKEVIQWTSSIAGAFGFWAILLFSRLLAGGRPILAATVFCSIATVATVQLFFGYVEHYATSTACCLWFLYLGSRALLARRGMLPAAAMATLAMGVHLGMLSMLPALAYLAWECHLRGNRGRQLLRRALSLSTVTLLPAVILFFTVVSVGYLRAHERGFGGGDGIMFVPLWELRGSSQYLFLRPAHLLAVLNLQLLVAPMALLTSLVVGVNSFLGDPIDRDETVDRDDATDRHSRVFMFLALAAAGFFGLTVVFNPDLGPRNDWDLFSPVGLLLSCLAAAIVVRRFERQPERACHLLLFIASVNLCRTIPWLLYNLKL